MSIERCFTHDRNWDSDFHEECPQCRFAETTPALSRDPGLSGVEGGGDSSSGAESAREGPTASLTDVPSDLDLARAFYLAVYENDGGRWDLVDPRYHHVWVGKAKRFAEIAGLSSEAQPIGAAGETEAALSAPDTPKKTELSDYKRLEEELRESAQAFRDHPIFTADGDPVLLTVQADELERAADALSTLQAREAELVGEVRDLMSELALTELAMRTAIADRDTAEARSKELEALLAKAVRHIEDNAWRMPGVLCGEVDEITVPARALINTEKSDAE